MKALYTPFFLLFSALSALGQITPGSIEGAIKTSDGNPAEFVNVSVEGTAKGAVADRSGIFQIRNLKPGSYVLVASFVGLETQQQTVGSEPARQRKSILS